MLCIIHIELYDGIFELYVTFELYVAYIAHLSCMLCIIHIELYDSI